MYKRIALRLDLEPSAYLQSVEVGPLCEEAYLALWDILISSLGDEGPWERQTVTTVANNDQLTLTLAQGCYRMLRLEFKGDGQVWKPVGRLSLTADDMDEQPRNWASAGSFKFLAQRLSRATEAARSGLPQTYSTWRFTFSPIPSAVYSLRLYYYPPPPVTFTWAGDVLTYSAFPDDFPEFVVNYVAAKMAAKQESDPAPFLAALDAQKLLIEHYCKPHTINVPQFVPDLRSQQSDEMRDPFWDRR